jgi:hypothetical protein
MGRFYNGTISGKFWFGLQNSNDACNFKPDNFEMPSEYFEYFSCGCIVINLENLYCNNCYKNYEEHFESIDEYDKDCIDDGLLAYESGHVEYNFVKSELNYIQDKLKSLEIIIGEDNIKQFNYKIDSKEKYFEYNINDNALDGFDNYKTELAARYCFGKQIEKALIDIGECYINCEL